MEETKEEGNPVSLIRTALDEMSKNPKIPLPFYNGRYDTQTFAIKLRNNPNYLLENGMNGNYGK